jgi:hypothetical protein
MLSIPKKNVTEADVKATEARLAASFAGLKTSITTIPSQAVKPVTDTVRAHPYASVAAAAGAGFVLYSLLNVLIPKTKIIEREVNVQPQIEVKAKRTSSTASRILSQVVTLATPYITSYVQNEVARVLSKREKSRPPSEREIVTGP